MKLRLSIMVLLFSITACGEKPAEEAIETEQMATAAEAAVSKPPPIPRTASNEGASVFFITPADGATVTNPISVEFGIAGMDVVKAGNNQMAKCLKFGSMEQTEERVTMLVPMRNVR